MDSRGPREIGRGQEARRARACSACVRLRGAACATLPPDLVTSSGGTPAPSGTGGKAAGTLATAWWRASRARRSCAACLWHSSSSACDGDPARSRGDRAEVRARVRARVRRPPALSRRSPPSPRPRAPLPSRSRPAAAPPVVPAPTRGAGCAAPPRAAARPLTSGPSPRRRVCAGAGLGAAVAGGPRDWPKRWNRPRRAGAAAAPPAASPAPPPRGARARRARPAAPRHGGGPPGGDIQRIVAGEGR